MDDAAAERMRDEYEKRVFDLKQLLEISKSLNSTLDYGILIESILYIIMGQMKVLKAALYVRKGIDSTCFSLHRNFKGFEVNRELDSSIAEDAPAMKLFVKECRPWTLDELRSRFDGGLGGLESLAAMDPCLVVPLKAKGSINGMIMLGDQILGEPFGDYDRELVQDIAVLASIAIHNAFLFEMTTTDMLTKLRLKHYLYSAMLEKMEDSAESSDPLSFIMMDIDDFKRFNDTYGHTAGDEVLRRVARLIQDQIRPTDIAARYGGEEFCVLLPATNARAALRVAERVRKAVLGHRIDYEGSVMSVSLSLGVAQYDPSRDLSGKALVDRADGALYKSKQAGKNRTTAAD